MQEVQVHPQKFWIFKNLGKVSKKLGGEILKFLTTLMKIFDNINKELYFFVLSVQTKIYSVIENTLNIYKSTNFFQ